MDEKENNLYDDKPLENDVNQESDDTLEEKDGVKYETNDNWQFDAEAPTLNNNLFDTADYPDSKEDKSEKKSDAPVISDDRKQSNQIVINKEPLKFIPLAIITLAVIAALVVLGIRYYTVPNGKEGNMMNPASVAATIDDNKISIGMYNLYFSSVVSQYEQYANYGYYNLDTTADYSSQYTTDEDGNKVSWMEYFENLTIDQIKNYSIFYNAAKKEGLTLQKSQKDTIDKQIESLKTSASEANQPLDDYIASVFGEYCTEDTVRLYMEQFYLTANYRGKYAIDNKPTDEEISKYYDEHKKDYYQINFSYLAVPYDASSDEKKAESEKTIKKYMSKVTDRQSIIDLVPTVYKDYIDADVQSAMQADSTLSKEEAVKNATETYKSNVDGTIYASQAPFSDEINNWLLDEKQPTGTVKYYANEETGYAYIILKTEQPTRSEDETYAVRHILIMPKTDDESQTDQTTGQTTYTDEQWAAAKEKANKIFEEYNSGDKTEYSFALLAEANSDDTASTSAGSSDAFGGLCEAVALGEMVPEFENWATDKSRKYGNTDIVKSDYGYHIMFFVYDKPSYESQLIIDARNAKFDSIIDEVDFDLHDSVVTKANNKFLDAKKAANKSQKKETTTQPTSGN